MFFSGFLFISTHISLDLLSLGSAKAYIGWGGKLNGRLMLGCVRNICTKNYQNLVIGFQVTAKNVQGVFLGHSVVLASVALCPLSDSLWPLSGRLTRQASSQFIYRREIEGWVDLVVSYDMMQYYGVLGKSAIYKRSCWPILSRQCAFGACQCICVRATWLWCRKNFTPPL